MDYHHIQQASTRYTNHAAGCTHSYGTAGFRENAEGLDGVFFTVGLLSTLRSKSLLGKTVGVMITASHNPAEDNGVKLIDPNGEMLESSWEDHATALANSSNLVPTLQKIVVSEKIDIQTPAKVIFGHDTRQSCSRLVKALQDGFNCFSSPQSEIIEGGLKTTPQLHYLVKCLNDNGQYGTPTEEGYYQKLSSAFHQLNSGTSNRSSLTVDCANGVGAPKLALLKEYLKNSFLDLELISTDIQNAERLNKDCGADYVKTKQSAPKGVRLEPFRKACSFDGDADRIVFFYFNQHGFRLLDGDKIATLVAGYLKDLLDQEASTTKENVRIGVVQTAYANGNSTRYIQQTLGLSVTCTPTGVKFLHHAAQEYDIGIYFEANGHGTVVFSDNLLKNLPKSSKLSQLASLINQTVGDSISDMLLVETILHQRNWGMADWDQAYDELPNRLVKVIVSDRKQFVTKDAERKLVEPSGMQDKIDQIVKAYPSGRSFVRPSGTEDCVRVYAEAATRELADELAFKVAGMVFDFCGKGERPPEFK